MQEGVQKDIRHSTCSLLVHSKDEQVGGTGAKQLHTLSRYSKRRRKYHQTALNALNLARVRIKNGRVVRCLPHKQHHFLSDQQKGQARHETVLGKLLHSPCKDLLEERQPPIPHLRSAKFAQNCAHKHQQNTRAKAASDLLACAFGAFNPLKQ